MLRLVTMLFLGMLVSWFLFFVELDNKSVAMHLADIWHSPVVQQKVRMVQRHLPSNLQDFAHVPRAVPQKTTADGGPNGHWDATEEHSEKDRRALDSLVQRVNEKEHKKK